MSDSLMDTPPAAPEEKDGGLKLSFIAKAFYEQVEISEIVSIGLAVALVASILMNFLLCCSMCKIQRQVQLLKLRRPAGEKTSSKDKRARGPRSRGRRTEGCGIYHVSCADSTPASLRPSHCTCRGSLPASPALPSPADQLPEYTCHYVNDVPLRTQYSDRCCSCDSGRNSFETESAFSEYSNIYY